LIFVLWKIIFESLYFYVFLLEAKGPYIAKLSRSFCRFWLYPDSLFNEVPDPSPHKVRLLWRMGTMRQLKCNLAHQLKPVIWLLYRREHLWNLYFKSVFSLVHWIRQWKTSQVSPNFPAVVVLIPQVRSNPVAKEVVNNCGISTIICFKFLHIWYIYNIYIFVWWQNSYILLYILYHLGIQHLTIICFIMLKWCKTSTTTSGILVSPCNLLLHLSDYHAGIILCGCIVELLLNTSSFHIISWWLPRKLLFFHLVSECQKIFMVLSVWYKYPGILTFLD
jgi:hypothetical protein